MTFKRVRLLAQTDVKADFRSVNKCFLKFPSFCTIDVRSSGTFFVT